MLVFFYLQHVFSVVIHNFQLVAVSIALSHAILSAQICRSNNLEN